VGASVAGEVSDGEETPSAASPSSPNITAAPSPSIPATTRKSEKSDKYDVDRIGQRGVGHGVNLYSQEKERALGEALASAIDRGAKFVTDPDINEYIRRLAQKIVRNSDAEVPFTIKVIDSPDLKICALPGGFLYVNKGLIMEVDSEAELAGLMAHEIAHVAARHATRFATRRYAWDIASIPLSFLGGAGLATREIAPFTLKKFSRDTEIEADLLGVEYQYAAGYDPQAFVVALEKLRSRDLQIRARVEKALPVVTKVPLRDHIVHLFSNYPPTEERIQRLQSEISALLPDRNNYVVDTSEFQEVKAKLAWANRPILRRHRPEDEPGKGPVLRRHPSSDTPPSNLAANSSVASNARLSVLTGHH
jgi:Zn-dependent protease with chaperone function